MAKIDIGVRQTPVMPNPEDLAHARNREDAPVLSALHREMNLRGGDKQNVSADYSVLPSDHMIFVDTDGGPVVVTMFDLLDAGGGVVTAYDEKQVRIRRDGASSLTVKDSSGTTLHTIADADAYLYMANNGSWVRIGT